MEEKIKQLIQQYNKGGFTQSELEWELLSLYAVSGSLAKQEALKEILEYIDSFHGSGHDFWWINSKVREKVYWMLERSKANDR